MCIIVCSVLGTLRPYALKFHFNDDALMSKPLKPSLPSFLLLSMLFWVTSGYAQQYQGTADERKACTPDALRLCGDYIPDPKKVELCLRQKKSALSVACRLVFDPQAKSARRR